MHPTTFPCLSPDLLLLNAQIRQHLMPKRLRVLVLGSASDIAAGTATAATGARKAGGSSSIKASSSSAAAGARDTG
jgi:hypothetical protein